MRDRLSELVEAFLDVGQKKVRFRRERKSSWTPVEQRSLEQGFKLSDVMADRRNCYVKLLSRGGKA